MFEGFSRVYVSSKFYPIFNSFLSFFFMSFFFMLFYFLTFTFSEVLFFLIALSCAKTSLDCTIAFSIPSSLEMLLLKSFKTTRNWSFKVSS